MRDPITGAFYPQNGFMQRPSNALYDQYSQQLMNNPSVNQYPVPSYQMQSIPNSSIKCRAVTSFDEAKAAMIDLDGSLNVFTNIPNGCIYTKRINLDGTAEIEVYVKQNLSAEQTNDTLNDPFITKSEFDAKIAEIMAQFKMQRRKPKNPTGGDLNDSK